MSRSRLWPIRTDPVTFDVHRPFADEPFGGRQLAILDPGHHGCGLAVTQRAIGIGVAIQERPDIRGGGDDRLGARRPITPPRARDSLAAADRCQAESHLSPEQRTQRTGSPGRAAICPVSGQVGSRVRTSPFGGHTGTLGGGRFSDTIRTQRRTSCSRSYGMLVNL